MSDRLSELPDDLLRRVLHLTPLKEAASTTALSRRWRVPLWLSSGALNLVTRVEAYGAHRRRGGDDASFFLPHVEYRQRKEDQAHFFSLRDTFLSEAVAALDAAQAPVTRLTLRLKSDRREEVDDFLNGDNRHKDGVVLSRDRNLAHVLLSHRAARRVEELQLILYGFRAYVDVDYTVTLDTLPLDTLRVLELTGCKGLHDRQGVTVVLPRLSSLRLSYCTQDLTTLQRVIDAAPELATVRLVWVQIYIYYDSRRFNKGTTHRLRLPTATVLVLHNCSWVEKNRSGYQTVRGVIDAPRMRRFRYLGRLSSISFSRPLLDLERVDLHDDKCQKDPDLDLATFWQFARIFTSTKEMKLRGLNHLEDVAILTEPHRVELLSAFRRLQRLQVHGVHWTKGDTGAVTIVNLLRCCPVLCTLLINLTAENQVADVSNRKGICSRIPQKIMQIPALGPNRSLECLQSSLRIVGLQFWLDDSKCLGAKLIEFFAENATVLEEMHINFRDEKLHEYMNGKTERWNSKRRKSGATRFAILPLKR